MKRHDPDVLSLLGGVLFVSVGSGVLLEELDAWKADVTWIGPVVLIALGLAGLLATVLRRREASPAPEET